MLEGEIEISSKQSHWPVFVHYSQLEAVAELIHLTEAVGNSEESKEKAANAKLNFLEN